jgi:hypothetical protein
MMVLRGSLVIITLLAGDDATSRFGRVYIYIYSEKDLTMALRITSIDLSAFLSTQRNHQVLIVSRPQYNLGAAIIAAS